MIELKDEFEIAFKGVYCFDSKKLEEARSLHLEGRLEEAKSKYKDVIEFYEKELSRMLGKSIKPSITFISPASILEESVVEVSLKASAYIEELVAKIYLAKGMLEDLAGGDYKTSLETSKEHYKQLSIYLQNLAGTCDPYEDVAQLMFESESRTAGKIAKTIEDRLKEKIK